MSLLQRSCLNGFGPVLSASVSNDNIGLRHHLATSARHSRRSEGVIVSCTRLSRTTLPFYLAFYVVWACFADNQSISIIFARYTCTNHDTYIHPPCLAANSCVVLSDAFLRRSFPAIRSGNKS